MLKNKQVCAIAILLSAVSSTSHGKEYDFDNFTINWDTVISAGTQMRISPRDKMISEGKDGSKVVGTRPSYTDPNIQKDVYNLDNLQQVLDNAFIINSNDGNNSFDQWDFTSFRLALISEADINFGNWGFFIRGKIWQDSVYSGSTGIDANSQAWDEYNANPVFGRNNGNNTLPGQFSPGARNYSKQGTRLLDAFWYGSITLPNDRDLSLRVGRQVISWGEALISGGGIASAINYVDSDIINQPGFELKELYQPTGSIFAQLAISDMINLEAYYQYEWNPVIISPSGSFMSEFDSIGAGGNTFMFLSGTEQRILGADLYDSQGNINPENAELMQFLPTHCGPDDDRDSRCRVLVPYLLETEEPGNNGQFGLALNFFLDNGDEAGLYFVNYHAKVPNFILPIDSIETMAPVIDLLLSISDPDRYKETLEPQGGFQGITDFDAKLSTTQITALLAFLNTIPPGDGSVTDIIKGIFNNPESLKGIVGDTAINVLKACNTPVCKAALNSIAVSGADALLKQWGFNSDTYIRSINYRLQYFDNIHLIGATYSTVLGDANVATEVSYRLNAPLMGGDVPRTPRRWQIINWHVNSVMVFGPSPLWDFSSFTAEAMSWYVPGALEYDGNDLSNPKRLAVQNTPLGLGMSVFWTWEYHSVFPGWDVIVPWYLNYGVLGASFTSGYRNNQGMFATGATFRNSGGFEAALGVKAYFGAQDDQFQMLTQDRSVLNLNVKYSF